MGIAGLVLILMTGPGRTEGSAPVEGPAILTVSGLDPGLFPGGTVALTLASLQTMDRIEITTSTIWTKDRHTYAGVLLKDLTDSLAIEGGHLRLHALNEYQVDIPVDEASSDAPILAYSVDGALMSVRDKGPLWLIYPFDAAAVYRTDTIYARSIWQLYRIEVLR